MKSFICLFLLLPIAICAANIEGNYSVSGNDPYEKNTYTGTATIKKDKNEVFQITWNFNDGSKNTGTGLLSGSELSVVFSDSNEANKQFIGLQIYKITDAGMEGTWVLLNQSLIGSEKLTKP